MAMSRSVSVIIPAHDSALTLPALLEALAKQTARPMEVIVVDDASSDGTASTARAMGARVVVHGENLGPGAARNSGAAEARGEVLAFTDADCVVPADWIERMLGFMDERGLRLVTSGYLGPVGSGTSDWFQHWEKRCREPFEPRRICATNGHSLAVERSLYLETGGMDSIRTSEDFLFGLRLAASGVPVTYDPANGVYHRFRPGLGGYARQKMLFAQNSVLVSRTSGLRMEGAATFSPARTVCEMLLTWGALLSAVLWGLLMAAGRDGTAAAGAAAVLLASFRGVPFLAFLRRQAGQAALDGGRYRAGPVDCLYSLFFLAVRDAASTAGIVRGLWLSYAAPSGTSSGSRSRAAARNQR